jgi:protein-S-isoprenylcysteine O-methyltransferase Ste14
LLRSGTARGAPLIFVVMTQNTMTHMWITLKIIGLTVLIPGIEALLIPSLLSNGRLFDLLVSAQGWHLSGWLFVCSGFLLYVLSATGFAVGGRGTPAPIDPPKQLVVAGAHAFTRNPMYVAIISFVFGLAVLSGLWCLFAYSVALFLFFHSVVMIYEEPTLRKKYARDYEEYCQGVPRWGFRIRPYYSDKQTGESR